MVKDDKYGRTGCASSYDLMVFLCFQGVEKGYIVKEWVKEIFRIVVFIIAYLALIKEK